LGQVPPGVNRDEASIGYTAYSLLHTGKDEYGRFLPVSFQSFGDWKLPVYIYETVLSVALFGLNTFAVRIPSAIAGILLVILVYFLVKELFKDKTLALTVMFFTAISPWSIHLSRVESESNTAVTLVTAGVLLLLKSFKKQQWLIIPSAVFLALSFSTYAANYIFTTFLTLGLFFIYRKEILNRRFGIAAVIIYILLSSFIWFKITGANVVKISGIGIFGDPSIVHAEIEVPRNEHSVLGKKIAQIFHNRAVYGLQRFAQNYFNAFSPEFLFIRGGGNHAHNILDFGNMYLIDAPFLLLGFIYLVSRKKTMSIYFVLWWFLIAPLAPSITKDAPHTNRMFTIFPILPLVTSFGVLWFIRFFRGFLKYGILVSVAVLYFFNIGLYLDRYYVHFPYEESQYWGTLYQQLNTLLSQKQFADKNIVMEDPENSPYIYFLFYSKYDPALYQKQVIRYPITPEGFVHVKKFGRYEFRNVDLLKDLNLNDTIIVVKTTGIPSYFRNIFKTTNILLPSGDPMYSIIEGSDKIKILPDNLRPFFPFPLPSI
jgi:4-amino-4-deoxy-L-arabinose transferase-like glycosyltransferase